MSARSKYTRKDYTVAQCAYMAGIMDGEGSFYIGNYSGNRKNGDRHYQTVLSVSSTDIALIDWLHQTFGGMRREYTPNQMAKNCRKKVYSWAASSDRLLHICELILPYLTIKKRQCEIMIEMRKTYHDAHNQKGKWQVQRIPQEILDARHRFFLELRSLHGRNYQTKSIESLAPCCPTELSS